MSVLFLDLRCRPGPCNIQSGWKGSLPDVASLKLLLQVDGLDVSKVVSPLSSELFVRPATQPRPLITSRTGKFLPGVCPASFGISPRQQLQSITHGSRVHRDLNHSLLPTAWAVDNLGAVIGLSTSGSRAHRELPSSRCLGGRARVAHLPRMATSCPHGAIIIEPRKPKQRLRFSWLA